MYHSELNVDAFMLLLLELCVYVCVCMRVQQ